MHRSVVLGALSRAEVDSKHRLRGLALEGVHGLGEYRAQPHLNARHGPHEPNNSAGAADDDGRARAPGRVDERDERRVFVAVVLRLLRGGGGAVRRLGPRVVVARLLALLRLGLRVVLVVPGICSGLY